MGGPMGVGGRRRAGETIAELGPALAILRDHAGTFWACRKCTAELGPADGNYKAGCIREDRPVAQSNPLVGAPERFIDDAVEFRQFYCPGCGGLIENEIAVAQDAVLRDIEISL